MKYQLQQEDELSPFCPEDGVSIREFERLDPSLGMATFEITGRRPSTANDYYFEEICTFALYVLEGSGSATVNGEDHKLSKGSMLYVIPGTKWSLEGEMKYLVATSPGFFPEQMSVVS